jgi:hypothetical protein
MSLEQLIAQKTREIESLGACRWGYRCPYCIEGYVPIQSSVTDAMVHPDTPVGRVICKPWTPRRPAERERGK